MHRELVICTMIALKMHNMNHTVYSVCMPCILHAHNVLIVPVLCTNPAPYMPLVHII